MRHWEIGPGSVLRCEECGCVTEDARGWIAQLIMGDEEEPDLEPCVVAYCPACAEREFSFRTRRRIDDDSSDSQA